MCQILVIVTLCCTFICIYFLFFRSVRSTMKSDYQLLHVCLSVCLSFCPSVFPYRKTRLPLDETWYLNTFLKSVEKILALLKSDKNNGYFTWRPEWIFDHISGITHPNTQCHFLKDSNPCILLLSVTCTILSLLSKRGTDIILVFSL
jgi:hypothetical protein